MVVVQINILKCTKIGKICPVKEHNGPEGE
jgi:hypothetical protein